MDLPFSKQPCSTKDIREVPAARITTRYRMTDKCCITNGGHGTMQVCPRVQPVGVVSQPIAHTASLFDACSNAQALLCCGAYQVHCNSSALGFCALSCALFQLPDGMSTATSLGNGSTSACPTCQEDTVVSNVMLIGIDLPKVACFLLLY